MIRINKYFLLCSFIIGSALISGCSGGSGKEEVTVDGKKKVLVFTKTAGYRHGAIDDGKTALEKLALENNFVVEFTEDSAQFNDTKLRQFSSVVFLNTTGDVLYPSQQNAFERYIQAGGGYVGIHAASDTEAKWPWYGKLVGGYFKGHPSVQQATMKVHTQSHAATAHLSAQWQRADEWYNFRDLNPDVNVLLSLDESTYEGGENGENHPIAWYQQFDGGRSFYTGLGHVGSSYQHPLLKAHLYGGIYWAATGKGLL